MQARALQLLAWAAVAGMAACSPPPAPSLSDQALAAIQKRRGPNYKLEFIAERTVGGHPLICGYASGEMFVFSGGRLYLGEDMKPDRPTFLDRNCGSDLPRVFIRPVP
jgi:hypothetical protein